MKPLTTKAYDRRASGDCGTSGYFLNNMLSCLLSRYPSAWKLYLSLQIQCIDNFHLTDITKQSSIAISCTKQTCRKCQMMSCKEDSEEQLSITGSLMIKGQLNPWGELYIIWTLLKFGKVPTVLWGLPLPILTITPWKISFLESLDKYVRGAKS